MKIESWINSLTLQKGILEEFYGTLNISKIRIKVNQLESPPLTLPLPAGHCWMLLIKLEVKKKGCFQYFCPLSFLNLQNRTLFKVNCFSRKITSLQHNFITNTKVNIKTLLINQFLVMIHLKNLLIKVSNLVSMPRMKVG